MKSEVLGDYEIATLHCVPFAIFHVAALKKENILCHFDDSACPALFAGRNLYVDPTGMKYINCIEETFADPSFFGMAKKEFMAIKSSLVCAHCSDFCFCKDDGAEETLRFGSLARNKTVDALWVTEHGGRSQSTE